VSLAVSIVVPVHGRAALTKRCLDTLLATLPPGCEVIVVDDASSDETPTLLRSYGERIRRLRLPRNLGYGGACNAGAASARHDTLVFLNNDTEPHSGWLQALTGYAAAHRRAAIVGAKLLYPTGVVQHAGVAIGQDGYPHNLYAGLPAEHPAVNRSRALQAVTGACMLVARPTFERLGGFDTGYSNSLEDVDLCLRAGEQGAEVHYCHEAVLTHLESASRGREERFERSVARYRERWRDRVARDDLSIYAQDGLLGVEYGGAYPLRLSVSPQLAALGGERQPEIEALLEAYAAQVADLMGEVVRLTALAGSRLAPPPALPAWPARPASSARSASPGQRASRLDHRAFLAEVNGLEERARALQERLQDAAGVGGAAADGDGDPGADPEPDGAASHAASPRVAQPGFTASRTLGYRRLVERVRSLVAETVPQGSTVLVVSRGDRELLKLGDAHAAHFPQSPDGDYLGHHPRDSREAIDRLERLRGSGADYLVLPSTSFWWLEHYTGFARHLRERYPALELGVCSIFQLRLQESRRALEVSR
jgi:GT2 family glycosyltransferase